MIAAQKHSAFAAVSRALEFLDIATNLEPDSVYCAFIRFKVLLTQGETVPALAEVRRLLNCRGFNPQILKVRNMHCS